MFPSSACLLYGSVVLTPGKSALYCQKAKRILIKLQYVELNTSTFENPMLPLSRFCLCLHLLHARQACHRRSSNRSANRLTNHSADHPTNSGPSAKLNSSVKAIRLPIISKRSCLRCLRAVSPLVSTLTSQVCHWRGTPHSGLVMMLRS